MVLNLTDRVLKVIGQTMPDDIEGLMQKLHPSIPEELFYPDRLSIDTTYLDADLRIVRYTGSKRWEGVRNIFLRSHSYSCDLNRISNS